jgi:hypothetical protein
MFTFTMKLSENFASFHDPDNDQWVFVDSFDNREFSVRFGTVDASAEVGTIIANSDADLNVQLTKIIEDAIKNGHHPS